MLSSLRSRLFLGFVFVIAVVLVISAVSLLLFVARSNLVTRLELRNTAARLIQRPNIDLDNLETFDAVVDRIAERIGYRVVVIDPDGQVVADSHADESAGFPPILRIPLDPLQNILSIQDLDGKLWLYTGFRLRLGYGLIILESRQPFREMIASPIRADLLKVLAQSGAVALGIALLLAFLISRSVASPLRKISDAARQVAGGNQIAVKPEGPKEVRLLGEAFNDMSARVHASQQSQRDFIANVSHELKTPLTSVQGFAQALLDGTASTPGAQEKAAQVIYDEAGRMYRMVLDLLELAKLDAGTIELRRERVELDRLLKAVVDRFAPQSKHARVEIVNQVGSLPIVAGDGDLLSQVFDNLVENAIKHTPSGGQVRISATTQSGQALVMVSDGGPGIPEEEIPRIFERFYQLDKSRKGGPAHGAGLGLAIANQIIQAHGGTIEVQSVIGRGSAFTVSLPASRHTDDTLPASSSS